MFWRLPFFTFWPLSYSDYNSEKQVFAKASFYKQQEIKKNDIESKLTIKKNDLLSNNLEERGCYNFAKLVTKLANRLQEVQKIRNMISFLFSSGINYDRSKQMALFFVISQTTKRY